VVTVGCALQQARSFAAGGLHDDDPTDALPVVTCMLQEAIDEGPEKPTGTELQNRFHGARSTTTLKRG
jgi:hypothetical protein